MLVLSLAGGPVSFAHTHVAPVEFIREAASVDLHSVPMSHWEEWRVEHFLAYMFPVRELRRVAFEKNRDLTFWPASRSVKYAVVEQQGYQFVLVNYRAKWQAANSGTAMISLLAIYRIERGGPNQVWRSRPWLATYRDAHFLTAKSGWRNVVFYQEGGNAGEFGLASVFTFYNKPAGLLLHDLTPTIPWLRAEARFPFRPLYGEEISMRRNAARELILRTHDEAFNLSMSQRVRPSRSWLFSRARDRFEPLPVFSDATERK